MHSVLKCSRWFTDTIIYKVYRTQNISFFCCMWFVAQHDVLILMCWAAKLFWQVVWFNKWNVIKLSWMTVDRDSTVTNFIEKLFRRWEELRWHTLYLLSENIRIHFQADAKTKPLNRRASYSLKSIHVLCITKLCNCWETMLQKLETHMCIAFKDTYHHLSGKLYIFHCVWNCQSLPLVSMIVLVELDATLDAFVIIVSRILLFVRKTLQDYIGWLSASSTYVIIFHFK